MGLLQCAKVSRRTPERELTSEVLAGSQTFLPWLLGSVYRGTQEAASANDKTAAG